MRDRLVHHYFEINLAVLWSTVTEDLPRLLAVQDWFGDPRQTVVPDPRPCGRSRQRLLAALR